MVFGGFFILIASIFINLLVAEPTFCAVYKKKWCSHFTSSYEGFILLHVIFCVSWSNTVV